MNDRPNHLNAYQFFLGDRLAEGLGDRAAVHLSDRLVSYDEVDRMVAGQEQLLREVGVGKGDRVLIVLPDGVGFVAGLFAIFRLGAVAVMLNPGLARESMSALVELSRAKAAIVHVSHLDDFESSLERWRPAVLSPDAVEPGEHTEPVADTSLEDPAIWLFSGGTTGVPKAVSQTHRSLVNTTQRYAQQTLGLVPEDITISIPKLYFGYATGSNLLFPFSVGGSTVLFEEHPTPSVVFEKIEHHRPTVLINVPSAVNQMVSAPGAASRDLSSLRFSTSAGEALPETLYHRWVETFGVELLDGLGTAEMWHIFVTNRLGDVRPGTLGRVVEGFEIEARNEEDEPVEPGSVGRLWVRGDSLGLGYVGDPGQTEEAFRGEWFVGGDLVSIDEDGYVTHRGRGDDAIKVKGKWFRPQELESVLLDHESVKDCAVVAIEDDAGLSKPVAFVIADGDVTEQELIDWVLNTLEPYKHPRRVFIVDQLPKTHLGKVDRGALKRSAVEAD